MFYAFDKDGWLVSTHTTFTDAMTATGVKFVKFVPNGTRAVPRQTPRNFYN